MPTLDETLKTLAALVVERCPDLRQTARKAALDAMAAQGLSAPDPDLIYWHRFTDAASSPHTFTGWAHYQRPVETLTLVQLVMRRFIASDQEAADNLVTMGGFYTAGAVAERYDESNEVRLLPGPVLQAFWDFDIKPAFLDRAKQFWATCKADYRALAKARFLSRALEARQHQELSDADLAFLLGAVNGGQGAPVSLATLQAEYPVAHGVIAHRLCIGTCTATDLLLLEAPAGALYLYVPSAAAPLQRFPGRSELHWWLLEHNNELENRARFMAHFPLHEHTRLNAAIDVLYSSWGTGDHSLLQTGAAAIEHDVFSNLTDHAQARMVSDASLALHSNGELRKKMWLGYLGAFNTVFGPLAALDWPITLAVLGADVAEMGLNIDQAVHAPTTADREAAVVGAIGAGIDALLNGLFLWGAWAGEPALPAPEPAPEPSPLPSPNAPEPSPASLPTLTPENAYPTTPAELAHLFETDELLAGLQPGQDGTMKGVYVNAQGRTFIELDGMAYAVRFSNDLACWMVVDPDNPFSFHRSVPVRLNSDGQWELLPRPGLAGGGRWFGKWPWGQSRGPAPLPSEATAYDMPEPPREYLRNAANDPTDRTLQGYVNLDYRGPDPVAAFEHMRDRLWADARAFFAERTLPARPAIAPLPGNATPKETLQALFSTSTGIVIGESHSALGSKQFLLDNMPRLAKEKVRTLYMEHVLTDYHQADLDTFSRTGNLPERLETYLRDLDAGHYTDPAKRYTFLNIVKAAVAQRIKVQGVDCLASYRAQARVSLGDPLARQKLMNYFSHTVITAEQARNGQARWVALVGNSHASTYGGVPGIAELEGAVAVRFQDVAPGTPSGLDLDPGLTIRDPGSPNPHTVRSDLRVRVPVVGTRPLAEGAIATAGEDLQALVRRPGSFVIRRSPELTLYHRSRTGELLSTRIHFDHGRPWIDRPTWRVISGRRFSDLGALTQALLRMGLEAA